MDTTIYILRYTHIKSIAFFPNYLSLTFFKIGKREHRCNLSLSLPLSLYIYMQSHPCFFSNIYIYVIMPLLTLSSVTVCQFCLFFPILTTGNTIKIPCLWAKLQQQTIFVAILFLIASFTATMTYLADIDKRQVQPVVAILIQCFVGQCL